MNFLNIFVGLLISFVSLREGYALSLHFPLETNITGLTYSSPRISTYEDFFNSGTSSFTLPISVGDGSRGIETSTLTIAEGFLAASINFYYDHQASTFPNVMLSISETPQIFEFFPSGKGKNEQIITLRYGLFFLNSNIRFYTS